MRTTDIRGESLLADLDEPQRDALCHSFALMQDRWTLHFNAIFMWLKSTRTEYHTHVLPGSCTIKELQPMAYSLPWY